MKLLPFLAVALACGAGAIASPPAGLPDIAELRSPEPGVLVSGRLDATDVEQVREHGVRQIIDLTPDAETPGFDEAAAVGTAGLAYANLPLSGPSDLTRENVLTFDALMRQAQRPVLVHCASGNRVGAVAALRAAWIERRSTEEAIAIGKAWGLRGLEAEVRKRLAVEPPEASR